MSTAGQNTLTDFDPAIRDLVADLLPNARRAAAMEVVYLPAFAHFGRDGDDPDGARAANVLYGVLQQLAERPDLAAGLVDAMAQLGLHRS